MVSIWLAGHAEELRESTLKEWLRHVRQLTPVNVAMLDAARAAAAENKESLT
jgi:hypothetical protein